MKKDLAINIEPRVNYEVNNGKDPKAAKGGAGPSDSKDPKAAPSKINSQTNKPYANYYERKLDEAE